MAYEHLDPVHPRVPTRRRRPQLSPPSHYIHLAHNRRARARGRYRGRCATSVTKRVIVLLCKSCLFRVGVLRNTHSTLGMGMLRNNPSMHEVGVLRNTHAVVTSCPLQWTVNCYVTLPLPTEGRVT